MAKRIIVEKRSRRQVDGLLMVFVNVMALNNTCMALKHRSATVSAARETAEWSVPDGFRDTPTDKHRSLVVGPRHGLA